MKNLIPFSTNYFEEFKKIALAKQEPRKSILEEAYDQIEEHYVIYENSVSELGEMNNHKIDYSSNTQLKDALLHCYESSTTPLDLVKKKILLLQSSEFRYKCQYCGINIPDTFDHYLPKSIFPEFSVLPINLFPCCAQCNRVKGNEWISASNNRTMINLYYDKLSEQAQFLFCRVYYEDDIPRTKFFLNFSLGMDNNSIYVINSHYDKLDLLSKYSRQSTGLISTIEKTLMRKISRSGDTQVVLELLDHAESIAEVYGYNYWEVSLYQALSKSEEFISTFENLE